MHKTKIKTRAVALAAACVAATATAGCRDFLKSSEAVNNPNVATVATAQQLFIAYQANSFGILESSVAMFTCEIMQQCSGIGGRFVETFDKYNITDASFSFDFSSIYSGGGLVDIRKVEASADARGDKQFEGIAEVWEAYMIGTAADLWGDIPYREAASAAVTPKLDPQEQVYADIQLLLDKAITDLGGAGPGPGPTDLVYGGTTTKWVQAAHTLKARFYLHTVEKAGNTVDNTAYTNARTQALLGISTRDNDFKALHGTVTDQRNIWEQFQTTSFGQDLVAGAFLANLLTARGETARLAEYYGQNPLGGYGGNDVNGNTPSEEVSPIIGGGRITETFQQPLITWAENQLILAEANFKLSGAAAAQPFLNAVRASFGLPTTVTASLQSIINEKYIALYQNIEVWSDYKRTCLPALRPFPTALFLNKIPGRLYYGSGEANANPNIPTPANQLANGGVGSGRPSVGGFRNPNDPNACP